jgi:hypothetical protein
LWIDTEDFDLKEGQRHVENLLNQLNPVICVLPLRCMSGASASLIFSLAPRRIKIPNEWPNLR